MGIETVLYPPYSPDLVPCDFCLFPKLRGCRYETIEEMKEAVTKVIDTYGLPKESVTAIMMLYRNIKVKVLSPDGDTKYFDIVAGVLQGNTLAPYLFIICLDYMLRTSIDKIKKWF